MPARSLRTHKRYILVNTLSLILKTEVHSAGIQDRDGAALVFKRLTRRFPHQKNLRLKHLSLTLHRRRSPRLMVIVQPNQNRFEVLPMRRNLERIFAWLGIRQRLAEDFESFAETSLAFIQSTIFKLKAKRLPKF